MMAELVSKEDSLFLYTHKWEYTGEEKRKYSRRGVKEEYLTSISPGIPKILPEVTYAINVLMQ